MPKYYLLRPDGSISDIEYSETTPDPRTDGQWIQGEPPVGYKPYVQVSLSDQLKAIVLALPDSVQAQFAEVAAGVDLALRNGKPEVAKLEIQALTLPAELEPVRTKMLGVFGNG